MPSLIEMTNVCKSYDGKNNVLDGLNFSMKFGEIAFILGSSGSGKSTFLNIAGLLDNMSSGEYVFTGKMIKKNKLNSYYKIRSTDIGFIFQAYCLIEAISVRENILLPYLYNDAYIDKKVCCHYDEIAKCLNLTELSGKRAAMLSGGERQRVAIARAMMKSPKLIIADEPTGNLDETNANIVIDAFKDISSRGTAVLIVTHNKRLTEGSKSAYLLQNGVLVLC
ncbi:MAG: ABC transporter ATP-binding protein [Oscillospiraceae bacterium]|jgi:ABC-type lipoprotein export system ATPase subunit|nr:ABC transporter ATP-binding protein [Oscillospiraceae bacterium]